MKILENPSWIYYLKDGEIKLDPDKCGKWMYFFNDEPFVASVCQKAVERGVVQEAKHTNGKDGVACFYIDCDDTVAHKRVISFLLENNLVKKTKTGKLYNISFKLDNQTRAGEYGLDFESEIKLSNFVDLYTGEFK